MFFQRTFLPHLGLLFTRRLSFKDKLKSCHCCCLKKNASAASQRPRCHPHVLNALGVARSDVIIRTDLLSENLRVTVCNKCVHLLKNCCGARRRSSDSSLQAFCLKSAKIIEEMWPFGYNLLCVISCAKRCSDLSGQINPFLQF